MAETEEDIRLFRETYLKPELIKFATNKDNLPILKNFVRWAFGPGYKSGKEHYAFAPHNSERICQDGLNSPFLAKAEDVRAVLDIRDGDVYIGDTRLGTKRSLGVPEVAAGIGYKR